MEKGNNCDFYLVTVLNLYLTKQMNFEYIKLIVKINYKK